jgi:hypothetical protein
MLFALHSRVLIGGQEDKGIFRIIKYDDTAIYATLRSDEFDYRQINDIVIHESFLYLAPKLSFAEPSDSEDELDIYINKIEIDEDNIKIYEDNIEIDKDNIEIDEDNIDDDKINKKNIKLDHFYDKINIENNEIYNQMNKLRINGRQMLMDTKKDCINGIKPSEKKIMKITQLLQGMIFDSDGNCISGCNISQEESDEIDSLRLPLALYGNLKNYNENIYRQTKRKFED